MMEDLQQQSDSDSKHRYLMKSETLPNSSNLSRQQSQHYYDESPVSDYISTSCPESWQHEEPSYLSTSLPDKLKMEKPFFKALKKTKVVRKEGMKIKIIIIKLDFYKIM